MKPWLFGAGFALLGAADLAWIDLGLVPAALALETPQSSQSHPEVSQPQVSQPQVSQKQVALAAVAQVAVSQPAPAASWAAPAAPSAAPTPASLQVESVQPASLQPAGELTLLFDVNARSPREQGDLEALIAQLTADPNLRVQIDGHSDRNGSANYNDELSRERAEAVADALARRGIDRSRISSRGRGARAPIAAGNDAASLARNRRVEVHVERRKP